MTASSKERLTSARTYKSLTPSSFEIHGLRAKTHNLRNINVQTYSSSSVPRQILI